MNILIYEWNGYCYSEIKQVFHDYGISFDTLYYDLPNVFLNDEFCSVCEKKLREQAFDAVFSFNYFPLVARCCYKQNIKYISWSYDSPLGFDNTEETLYYPTNYIFFFDRHQTEYYRKSGYDNIYHMPLAANTKRLSQITPSKADYQKYGADVSFIGKLYKCEYNDIVEKLSPYLQGYLKAFLDIQSTLYGCNILKNILSNDIVHQINMQYTLDQNENYFSFEQIAAVLIRQVTNRERLLVLSLLSKHFQTRLYSPDSHPVLDQVIHMGTVTYMDYMPIVFKTTKINLNITLRSITSGIPLRAMDIMGSGGFLLSNYQPELAEYFINGKEIALYTELQEAYDLARYYLKYDTKRNAVAFAGYSKIKELFTYEIQLSKILSIAHLQ